MPSPSLPPLPVDAAIAPLQAALADAGAAVLIAPPGAGKTTRVPLALLDAPWLAGRKLVLLEPRRLAARAAARRMAATLGEPVGGTVGWRMRLDTRVSARTRLEVVTEGVLTRLVQDDPALEDVGAVLFDEFHERNLVADLGLALVLQTRELLRPDLRLLVMSATLEGAPVAALLGDAPVIRSEGRAFPVATHHAPPRDGVRLETHVAGVIRRAMAEADGDVLAFLPGAGEIARTEAALHDGPLPAGTDVVPLFGALEGDAQDRAIAPSPPGRRKVVLATNIAETSLTIEGVRVVVDAGLARVPRYDPATGMTRLDTVRVSRASADQRRGRAGRTAPGTCWRCWPDWEDAALLAQRAPEIREADLAPLALDLAVLGVRDPAELSWLDAPPPPAFAEARALLARLGALDAAGALTPHGGAMARVGLHPRLAHLVLAGRAAGHAGLACDVAALLAERDVVRGEPGGRVPVEMGLRVAVLRATGEADALLAPYGLRPDRDAVRRVREQARQLRRTVGGDARDAARDEPTAPDDATLAALLALAYPERVALRRAGEVPRFLLAQGTGAVLPAADPLARAEALVIVETDGRRDEARIVRAAPLTRAALRAAVRDGTETVREVGFDDTTGRVRAREVERYGALVLAERPAADVSADDIRQALLAAIAQRGLAALPWTDAARRTRERLAFARHLDGEPWPDVSDAALAADLAGWIGPWLDGARSLDDVARLDLSAALLARLPWAQRAALDAIAPTHVTVPTGSRIPVDYGDPEAPVVAVRLQELFGCIDTPRVGGGRVPVVLHLLSPAHRPVQVTRDLAGFWRTSYFDVRKDLRGRYPKHHWPDNPLEAAPTRRAKRPGERDG